MGQENRFSERRSLDVDRPDPTQISAYCAGQGITYAEEQYRDDQGEPEDFLRHNVALTPTVAHAVAGRRAEYLHGPLAARRALQEAGAQLPASPFVLYPRPDRCLLWPGPLTGSISHSRGRAAAAVAHRHVWASVGLDLERVIEPDTVAQILTLTATPPEFRWFMATGQEADPARFTALFCAKESAYKALFPVYGVVVDFLDLELTALTLGGARGTFSLDVRHPDLRRVAGTTVHGQLFYADGFLRALVHLRPSDLHPHGRPRL